MATNVHVYLEGGRAGLRGFRSPPMKPGLVVLAALVGTIGGLWWLPR